MANDDDVVRSVFITGLRNAHALEHEALALMDRQIDRLTHYPEMRDRLRMHRAETEVQVRRVEQILQEFDASQSALKDAALSLAGNMAALGHVIAPDEVLKNSFANLAFENFEVASYVSLITVAELGSYADAIPLLQETLGEERAMAAWVHDHLPMVTRTYIGLRQSGEVASH